MNTHLMLAHFAFSRGGGIVALLAFVAFVVVVILLVSDGSKNKDK